MLRASITMNEVTRVMFGALARQPVKRSGQHEHLLGPGCMDVDIRQTRARLELQDDCPPSRGGWVAPIEPANRDTRADRVGRSVGNRGDDEVGHDDIVIDTELVVNVELLNADFRNPKQLPREQVLDCVRSNCALSSGVADETVPDLLGLDQQLCFAVYSASLAMTRLYLPLLEPLGLTYPQYLVMLVLWETDSLTVSQVGDRLMLDSGTLTPLLKRLEAAGLVCRTRDTIDERRVIVTLTKTGRKLKQRAASVPENVMCATACDLDELVALTARLKALRSSLLTFALTLAS